MLTAQEQAEALKRMVTANKPKPKESAKPKKKK